jgi:hypothetical protein
VQMRKLLASRFFKLSNKISRYLPTIRVKKFGRIFRNSPGSVQSEIRNPRFLNSKFENFKKSKNLENM